MEIWNNTIYKNIIKFIFYDFKLNKNKEWLFVGTIDNDTKKIIKKLNNLGINFKKLNTLEKNKLREIYGENVEIELTNKLLIDTELIFEDIHFDDNILDIKKKNIYLFIGYK